ncbi:hypothetical protein C7M84_004629, partial [Penaeus vannamei]
ISNRHSEANPRKGTPTRRRERKTNMASPRSRIFLFLAGFSCLLLLPRLQAQTAADADTGHDPGPQPQSVAGEEVKEGSHEQGEQALGSAEADTGHDPGPPPQRVAVEE